MKLKRVLLLLSAIAAFAAFAAPAAQAESWWSTDPGEVVLGDETEATTFTATGELSSTFGGFVTGPFVVHAHGFLWNGPEHGEGYITDFEITGEVPTPIPGCTSTGTNSTTNAKGEHAAQWPITLTTDHAIDISNLTFTHHYNATCQAAGFPAEASAEGTLTGYYNNETGCINFVNAGDLVVEKTGGTVKYFTNGSVCMHEDGGTFTSNTE